MEQPTEGVEDEFQVEIQAEAEARLAAIVGAPTSTDEIAPAPAEIPEWMQELAPPEEAPVAPAMPVAEEVAPIVEEPPIPDWLEGEGIPSGDEALAWLEQLAAGKEEELQAQAQAEAEARMAEIMGRPAPPEAPVVEAAPEEIIAPPVEEAIPAPAEAPDWMQEIAPPDVTIPVVEEAAPPAIEPALRETAIPPSEEAFGWIAFGEPQVPPQAVAAVEPVPPTPPVEEPPAVAEAPTPVWLEDEGVDLEAPVVEAVPEEAMAPPIEEAFGWTAFREPQAPPEAIAAVEEAPPAPVIEAAPEEIPPVAEAVPEEIVTPPVEEIAVAPEIAHWSKKLCHPQYQNQNT
jgi:hypothetical protein